MGGNPTHQELLDWLASEFVRNGWHIKPIQRLIVMSATYCQSANSATSGDAATAADPGNNLLSHARRQRLECEELRDAMLQVAGQINFQMYGPSVHPTLPDVLADSRYGWDPDPKATDRNRRSIYVLAQRNMRLPILEAFDQSDQLNSCPRRTSTTTASQALEMLNSELTTELAREWSGRLLAEYGDDEPKLVCEAYEEAYARPPSEHEIEAAEKFIEKQSSLVALQKAPKIELLPAPLPASVDQAKAAAIVDFCHAIFCSNEFLYLD
jgi:hypothetical protein